MKKYTHIFNFSSLIFDSAVIEMICDNPNELMLDETRFVVIKKDEYEVLKKYPNVIFDGEKDLINKYCEISEAVIVHGFSSMTQLLRIKKKNLCKIVWRTWGSDAGYNINDKRIIVNIYKRWINCQRKYAAKRLMAVGVCNLVDEIDIKNRFGDINTIEIPYFTHERELIDDVRMGELNHQKITNILVGHSGMSTDNHISIIDKLAFYKSESCRFYFVLSYGYPEYISLVKEYASKELGDKAFFICDKMNYKEYIMFLNKMDIAILDGKQSYALGNLGALLLMRKIFVLNEGGVIQKAFIKEQIPYVSSNKLGQIDFRDLTTKVEYDADNSNLVIHKYDDNIKLWKNVLDYIDEKVSKYENK